MLICVRHILGTALTSPHLLNIIARIHRVEEAIYVHSKQKPITYNAATAIFVHDEGEARRSYNIWIHIRGIRLMVRRCVFSSPIHGVYVWLVHNRNRIRRFSVCTSHHHHHMWWCVCICVCIVCCRRHNFEQLSTMDDDTRLVACVMCVMCFDDDVILVVRRWWLWVWKKTRLWKLFSSDRAHRLQNKRRTIRFEFSNLISVYICEMRRFERIHIHTASPLDSWDAIQDDDYSNAHVLP